VRPLLWTVAACIALSVGTAVAPGSPLMTFSAISFGGIAFVLLIAAAFLAVGESEDRERARESAERDARGG
jgi:hypothetical protein